MSFGTLASIKEEFQEEYSQDEHESWNRIVNSSDQQKSEPQVIQSDFPIIGDLDYSSKPIYE